MTCCAGVSLDRANPSAIAAIQQLLNIAEDKPPNFPVKLITDGDSLLVNPYCHQPAHKRQGGSGDEEGIARVVNFASD